MRWVERYENDNNIKRHNREAISYKVKKTHVKFVLDELKKNKCILNENGLFMINTFNIPDEILKMNNCIFF